MNPTIACILTIIFYILIGVSTWFPIEYAANSKHPYWSDEGHLERVYMIFWVPFYPFIIPSLLLYWIGKNIGKILIAIYVTMETVLGGKAR